MKITKQQAKSLILQNRGKYFTVAFTKRSNKKVRILTGRIAVRQGVIGIGQSYDPADYNLITVSETVQYRIPETGQIFTGRVQFRTIPIDGIRAINIGRRSYEVIQ